MRFTQLDAWLQWLETLHPRHIDLGLERVAAVAATLDLSRKLSQSTKVITVAGTNGKGSCVALLQGILSAAGYRVGCYTSPHLLRYNERVNIAGLDASDEALCAAFAAVDQARGETTLSYFEFGTLAAFYLFVQAELDVVVLEVGLGGRLDAVNIVDADVAVISSIALDHEAWLGSDRETIGLEKAGIMRCGRPAVFGDIDTVASVEAFAQAQGIPLSVRGRDFDFKRSDKVWECWGRASVPAGQSYQFTGLPLPRVLLDNAATVLQTLFLLDLPVSESAIRDGLANVRPFARLQSLQWQSAFGASGELLLDVAHNPASVTKLREYLDAHPAVGKTIALFAVMADKAIGEMIGQLDRHVDVWYLPQLSENPRAASPTGLASQLRDAALTVNSAGSSVHDTLDELSEVLLAGDRLLVFGSFFTVAEVMATLNSRHSEGIISPAGQPTLWLD